MCVAVGCSAKSPRAPDASVMPATMELLSGQAPRGESVGAVSSEKAARLVTAVDEVDRRYNYYGGITLATRREVGMVSTGHTVVFAVPGASGRCHRIAFAAETPGVSVTLRANSVLQGPVTGMTGAIGQYRQVCPNGPVVYRLEVNANSPTPVAFAVRHTEYPR